MGDLGPSTLLSTVLAVVLGGVLLMVVKRLCSGDSKPDGLSLPKGSVGWPIIGETLAFASDPSAFAQSRVKRYGSIFKSSLFFRKAILGSTPEFAKLVTTNSKLFRHTLPDQFANIAGSKSLALQNGPLHMSIKKILLKSVGPEFLRSQVQNFETIILENLASWERTGTVTGIDATQKISWDTSNWVLFRDSLNSSSSTPEGKNNFENFKQVMRILTSLPVNLPGTTYSTSMKARAALMANFKTHIERTKAQSTKGGALFEVLLGARDDPEVREELQGLDDDILADNMFFINFAAYDTTSTNLVWILKFLLDYPDVFRRIQPEQQEILKSKDPSVEGPRLTWEDTRKMFYTQKFFQEVQRYLSLSPVSFTEAMEDVEFGGHLIPKGWLVVVLANFIHSDPVNYPGLDFNPDRFDVTPKPYTYLPFSAGPHMCPGIEMAKLIALILIHHLTTTYMYESAAPDKGIGYEGVFPKIRGGYPIKLGLRK